jgi:L-ascorbate metabolism protein UlaG (beta-lactamase superfamily)
LGRRPSFCFSRRLDGHRSTYGTIGRMEITWYGGSCVRLKGREGIVAADPYRAIVGPTGRGLTADIVTFSHAEDEAVAVRGKTKDAGPRSRYLGVPLPTSVESAFTLDSPGEYEIHDVMVTGIRTFRDGVRGAERGTSTAFVYELDGVLAAHLGDVGHVLSQETLGEMGHVDIVCLAIGRALPPAPAAELVTQLGANLVVPLPVATDEAEAASDLERFLKEMSVAHPTPVARLNVSISTVPQETAVVVLEPRGRS